VRYHGRTDGSENDRQRDADATPRVLACHTQWKREGMTGEKIGLILLTLILIPLVIAIGPQALGALAGAAVLIGMIRLIGPKLNRN
jgi:hypothetical protein